VQNKKFQKQCSDWHWWGSARIHFYVVLSYYSTVTAFTIKKTLHLRPSMCQTPLTG